VTTMSVQQLLGQSLEMLVQSIAAPGNVVRTMVGTGSEPWATLAIMMFFLLGLANIAAVEYFVRRITGRDHLLVPDRVFVAEPDGGFSTWAFMILWALLQGPLSAVV